MISFPNAKINLGLSVLEKRTDGFHNLETVFFPVGWNDALEFVISDHFEFTTSGIPISGDPESNLVIKAYRILQHDYHLPNLKIHLHKNIPFGAGLGGGSSDAAFMLEMLNKAFKLNLSEDQLIQYAARLGSDCAFFIINKPVFATGRGEIMNIINRSLNPYFVLLVKPPVEISTALAFKNIVPHHPDTSLVELIIQPIENWKEKIFNQFELSVFQEYPQLKMVKNKLYESGAIYASLSGSGSCLYGIFHHLPDNWQNLFPANYLTFSQQFQID